MRPLTKLALRAAPFLIGSWACSGGDNTGTNPPPAPTGPSLSVLGDSARPGTLITIRVRGVQVGQTALAGTLAGVALPLVVADDSTVVGFTPDVAAGQQQLQLALGAQPAQVTVSVRPGEVISDAQAYVAATVQQYRAAIPATAPAAVSQEVWSARLARLDSMSVQWEVEFAAASASDQLQAARLIASIIPPASKKNAYLSLADESAFLSNDCRTALAFLLTGDAALSVSAVAATGLIFAFAPGVLKLASLPVGVFAFKTVSAHLDRWAAIFTSCLIPESLHEAPPSAARVDTSVGASTGLSASRFFAGRQTALHIVAQVRPLDARDIGTDTGIDGAAKVQDLLWKAVADAPAALRSLLPSLPTPISRMPPQAAIGIQPVSPHLVRIENVAPATVTLSVSSSGNTLILTPTAPLADSTEFAFDVVHTQVPVRSRISGYVQGYRVASSVGVVVRDTLRFFPGVPQSFRLTHADGVPVSGTDYSMVSIANNTNSQVSVTSTSHTEGFTLRLETAATGLPETSFSVTYRGEQVQSVHAAMTAFNYVLELQRYHPTYENMTPIRELRAGDALVTPNGQVQYFRLKLDGQYVRVAPYDLIAAGHSFGGKDYAYGPADHHVPNYPVKMHDATNRRDVIIPLDVTLSNAGYRRIVGRTLTVTSPMTVPGVTYTFHENQTFSTSFGPSPRPYSFSSTSVWFFDCGTSREALGIVQGVSTSGMLVPTDFIIIYADGTFGLNGGYSCPGPYEYVVQ